MNVAKVYRISLLGTEGNDKKLSGAEERRPQGMKFLLANVSSRANYT